MQYIKEITVDLSGEMYFSYITAVQGDENSRFVKITLLSGGVAFVPPEGAAAVLRCKKPNGTFVFNDATINEDGTITAELTENMLAAAGNCKCEVSIYGSDKSTLTSVPFIVKVTQAAVNPDITSTDEYTALTSALNRIDDAKQIANDALKESTEALNNIEEIEDAVEKASSDAAMHTVEVHNAAIGTHEDIRLMATEAKTIALGKANSLVFDTKEQLDSWVAGTYTRSDGKTTADLKVGDNLYIVELGVPDYWWDGSSIQPLGAEKPNLADYYTINQINEKIGTCIFGQMSEAEYDAEAEAGTLDAGRIYFVY